MSKEKAKEIREKAAPFVNWLRTAEEETSDEEGQTHMVVPSMFMYMHAHTCTLAVVVTV